MKSTTGSPFDKLRSAKPVTDFEAFARSFKQSEDLHTTVELTDDGVLQVRKRTGACTASITRKNGGAPTVNPSELPAKAEAAGLPWIDDYVDRWVPYWGSDERVDAHGDIVVQEWLFDEFETNPVMPFCHNWGGLPVGNCIDWQVLTRTEANYTGRALWLLGIFATEEQYEFADSVYRLVRARFLRAGSVGFTPDEVIEVLDEAERAKLGLGRWGRIYRKNHLFEFSPCLLGANTGALTLLANAKKKGQLKEADLIVIRELARVETLMRKKDRDAWRAEDRRYLAIAKTLFPRTKLARHEDLEQPFEGFAEAALRSADVTDDAGEEDTLEKRVERIECAMEQGFVGISEQLDDLRALLETNAVAGGADDDETNGDDEDGETETPATSRARSTKNAGALALVKASKRVGPKMDRIIARRKARQGTKKAGS